MNDQFWVEAISGGISIIGSAVGTVVGAVITSMLDVKKLEKTELAKIKAGKFGALLNALYDSGKMNLFEYDRCNNFVKIAKLAEKYLNKKEIENIDEKIRENYKNYKYEWYMKFFDYAGYIGEEKVQKLWAAVLANEFENPNTVPLSLLHTLSIMRYDQAKLFCSISRFAFLDYADNSPHLLLFVSSNRVAYMNSKITPTDLRELERLGLIECDFNNEYIFNNKKMFKKGNHIITVYGDPNNKNKIKAGNAIFTKDGKVLYEIIDDSYKEYRADILDFTIAKFKRRNCEVTINDRKVL